MSATFDLPNGATIIETAPPGQALGSSGPRRLADCRYQFISRAGIASCVSELQSITYLDSSAIGSNGSLPTFQLLNTDDVVFIGGTTESNSAEHLFKLSSSGTLTVLASTETINQSLLKFLVESTGRIVLIGKTVNIGNGDVAPFVWTISTSSAKVVVSSDSRTFGGQSISFLAKSPGGQAIIGLTNVYDTVADPATARIVVVNSDNTFGNLIAPASSSPTYPTDAFCSSPTMTRATFCNYGGTLITSAVSSGDSMFIVARSKEVGPNALPSTVGLFRILPSLEEVSLGEFAYPLLIGGSGDKYIVISGIDSGAAYRISSLNTDTFVESIVATGLSSPLPFTYSIRNSMLVGYGNAFPPTSLSVIQIPVADGVLGTPITTEFAFSAGVPSGIRFAY